MEYTLGGQIGRQEGGLGQQYLLLQRCQNGCRPRIIKPVKVLSPPYFMVGRKRKVRIEINFIYLFIQKAFIKHHQYNRHVVKCWIAW